MLRSLALISLALSLSGCAMIDRIFGPSRPEPIEMSHTLAGGEEAAREVLTALAGRSCPAGFSRIAESISGDPPVLRWKLICAAGK